IRGSVNEYGNDSISGNNCCSIRCDSIKRRVLVNPHQNPYYLNGGGDGLLNDLYTALSRIAPLTQDSIQGKSMFSFAITKDGSVDPNSIKLWRNRSVPEEYINAAIEAIKSLGKFEPGKLNGIPVKVTYNICIKYPIPLDHIKTDIE
ncbi:MAG: energy transducer TonB, partial [Bacteroidales bacterium]|nr:energy transducer TonB [Bacteroidales bacterium]